MRNPAMYDPYNQQQSPQQPVPPQQFQPQPPQQYYQQEQYTRPPQPLPSNQTSANNVYIVATLNASIFFSCISFILIVLAAGWDIHWLAMFMLTAVSGLLGALIISPLFTVIARIQVENNKSIWINFSIYFFIGAIIYYIFG